MLRELVATTRLVESFNTIRVPRSLFFVKYPSYLPLAPHPKSTIIDILVKHRFCIKAPSVSIIVTTLEI